MRGLRKPANLYVGATIVCEKSLCASLAVKNERNAWTYDEQCRSDYILREIAVS